MSPSLGTLHLETESPSMAGADITVQTFNVLGDVARERERQDVKWGEQAHDWHTWLAILTEEVGEVAKEVAEREVAPVSRGRVPTGELVAAARVGRYRAELLQVAAVAIAAVEALDYGSAGCGREAQPPAPPRPKPCPDPDGGRTWG